MSNFKLVAKAQVDETTSVNKYRDIESGLHLVFADVAGPNVSGFFVLPTEAHDDDGLPQILQRIILHGSEDYPYKGVLDLLENRCLGSGGNAWTTVDHTCFQVSTEGYVGFLNLLPVYLDHILYPKLEVMQTAFNFSRSSQKFLPELFIHNRSSSYHRKWRGWWSYLQ